MCIVGERISGYLVKYAYGELEAATSSQAFVSRIDALRRVLDAPCTAERDGGYCAHCLAVAVVRDCISEISEELATEAEAAVKGGTK